MPSATELLAAALRAAPRPYSLPPLPRDFGAAWLAGPETALAVAIEAARAQHDAAELFTRALAAVIEAALQPAAGDPAFQAQLLRARSDAVRTYLSLASHVVGDARGVRSIVNAVAHPGKGVAAASLAHLHALAAAGAWGTLLDAAAQPSRPGDPAAGALQRLREGEELRRLVAHAALSGHPDVAKFLALNGPVAGSVEASTQGRAAARAGRSAEQVAQEALAQVAAALNAATGGACRAVHGLTLPTGFPGALDKAKDEWDVALVEGGDLLLLAEVKASPSAVSSDYSRLLRGLLRLAHAEPGQGYVFPSTSGPVALRGEALRRLRPPGRHLPPQVVYCCSAPPEPRPARLAAATRAVLLAEPASLAYATRLQEGASVAPVALLPVWQALLHEPRLRSALHQDETARLARAAMVDPRDLAPLLL